MKTFTFEALGTGGDRVSGIEEAESSEQVVERLQGRGLMPVRIRAKSNGPDEEPPLPSASRPVEMMTFNSYGRRIRIRRLLFFYVPFAITTTIGLCIFVTGERPWVAFVIAVVALFVFGFIGSKEEAPIRAQSHHKPMAGSDLSV